MKAPVGSCPDHHVQSPDSLAGVMPEDWVGIRTFHQVADGISVGCLNGRPDSDWRVSGLAQPSFGVAVILEGECHMAFEGGAPLTIKPGMAILHSTHNPVQGWDDFKGQRSIRAVDIRFSPRALEQLCGQSLPQLRGQLLQDCSVPGHDAFLGSVPAWSSLSRVAADILRFPRQNALTSGLFLQAKAVEALALTLQKLGSEKNEQALPAPADRRRIQEVHAWLQHNFALPLTIRQLAQHAGLSEKRLQSGFAALYGQTVHACVHQTRMEAAADLLRKGCSVTDTAGHVGLSSLSHFIKSFRDYWGQTPKAWLKS